MNGLTSKILNLICFSFILLSVILSFSSTNSFALETPNQSHEIDGNYQDSGPLPRPLNQSYTTDLSPFELLGNLLCKVANQCLPALDPAIDQAIGYYHFRTDLGVGGKLVNDAQLPIDGFGFYVKTNSQNNRWSTDHGVEFIQNLARKIVELGLAPRVIMGDIAEHGGGPSPGHQSHQNGLDLDVGLLAVTGQDVPAENFPKDFVVNEQITDKFGVMENWQLINLAINSNWPLFVLAHPAIKKKFCEIAKASGEFDKYKKVLSLILPEPSHFDHFHFRLKCPTSSPKCIPREPMPDDIGC